METTIRLKPAELNGDMLDMVKSLIDKSGFTDIIINLSHNKPSLRLRKESAEQVQKKIENALIQLKDGDDDNLISFSAEEFELFSNSLRK